MARQAIYFRLLAAAAFLGGSTASAEIELVAPAELNEKVDDIRDSLKNPAATPQELAHKAGMMFNQAEDTHHIQVVLTQRALTERQSVAAPGARPTVESLIESHKGLVINAPPAPKDEEREKQLVHGMARMDTLHTSGLVYRDGENGEQKVLPASALGAYIWQVGAESTGKVLLHEYFFDLAHLIGEFSLSTLQHEGDHAYEAYKGSLEGADHIERELSAMRASAYFIATRVKDYSWKFAKLSQRLMPDPTVSPMVKATLVHIGKLLDKCVDSEDVCREYTKELYGDEKNHHHYHGDGHDHGPAPEPAKTAESGSPAGPSRG